MTSLAYALPDEPEVIATSAGELDASDIVAESWRRGDLSWKLDAHQLRVYDKYREWEQLDPANDNGDSRGAMTRVFVLDISRRWGKTWLVATIKAEDCLRLPGTTHTYACAIGKDITEIVIPIMEMLCEDAPDDVRPTFQISKQGQSMGFYFPNGSTLRLVGIDINPRGLRGRFSDGFAISEAAHVRALSRTVRNVIYPQFQRRQHARLILESNAPEDPEHDFDTVFVPDAQSRDAYVFLTIDDNDAIDPAEKDEFIRAAGGRGSPTCEREYYGVRVRDASTVVVPEFDRSQHVRWPPYFPEYADCYVVMDPGLSDMCAVLFGYWDFERGKLVIQRSWAKRNAGTTEVADMLRETERELWTGLQAWDAQNKRFRGQPFLRVSDLEGGSARILHELHTEHGIHVAPTAKDDADAQVLAMRTMFQRNLIEIVPNSGPLESQLVAARRKEGGGPRDWVRSEKHGHFDCVAALVYFARNVIRTRNPIPPEWVTTKGDKFVEPHAERTVPKPVANVARLIVGGPRRR